MWKANRVDHAARGPLGLSWWGMSRAAGMMVGLCWLTVAAGMAGEFPVVRFDVGQAVLCRVVPAEEAGSADPGEKTVEARFRVSTLILSGRGEHVEELLITISSPEGRLRLVDFFPATEVVSDVEGSIATVESDDLARSVDVRLGGTARGGAGALELQLSPSVGGGVTHGNSLKQSYQRLAPKRLRVASGTLDGGAGVFFKLRRDSQSTLEGIKEYSCRFAVPGDWRGDWVTVSCLARTARWELFGRRLRVCGEASFLVGLYLEGDSEAKQLAWRLSQLTRPPAGAEWDLMSAAFGRCPPPRSPLRAVGQSLDTLSARLCCHRAGETSPDELQQLLDQLARLAAQPDS